VELTVSCLQQPARSAEPIFYQHERDGPDRQVVERRAKNVTPIEKHRAAVAVADGPASLPSHDPRQSSTNFTLRQHRRYQDPT
jgi:hypothetical protein